MTYDTNIKVNIDLESKGFESVLDKIGQVSGNTISQASAAAGEVLTKLTVAGETLSKLKSDKSVINNNFTTVNQSTASPDFKKSDVESLSSALDKVSSVASGVMKGVNAAVGVVAGAAKAASSAIMDLGSVGLKYNSDMENYTVNFKNMLGSQEEAVKKVTDLKAIAASSPLEMDDLAKATQSLLEFGVENEKVIPSLQAIGDITYGNKEKFSSLSLAYGEVQSSGKLMEEDLNAMIESGFNPLLVISEKTGVSMDDLKNQMAQGAISADMVAEAFNSASQEGGQFYNGMEEANMTVSGLISTLEDNANALVGDVFIPLSDSLLNDVLPMAIDYIDTLSTAFKEGGVEGLVGAMGGILADVISKIAEYAPQFVESAVSIIQSLVGGITENLPLIVSSAMEILNSLKSGITEILPELIPIAVEIITFLAQAFIQYKELLFTTGIEILLGLTNGIVENLPTLIPMALQAIQTITDSIVENLPLLLDAALQIIAQLALGLAEALPELIPSVIEVLLAIVESLIDNIDMLLEAALAIIVALADGLIESIPKILDKAPVILDKLVEAIIEAVPKLVKAATEIIVKLAEYIIENLPEIIETGVALVLELIKGLTKAIPDIILAIPALISAIIDTLMETDWLSVGCDIINGIANGLVDGVGKVIGKIAEAGGGIFDGFKEFFGIQSPSKLMRDQIGKMIPQGIAIGIEMDSDKVLDSVDHLNKAVFIKSKQAVNLENAKFATAAKSVNSNSSYQAVTNDNGINVNVYMQEKPASNNIRTIAREIGRMTQQEIRSRGILMA